MSDLNFSVFYAWVFLPLSFSPPSLSLSLTHTHTHTHFLPLNQAHSYLGTISISSQTYLSNLATLKSSAFYQTGYLLLNLARLFLFVLSLSLSFILHLSLSDIFLSFVFLPACAHLRFNILSLLSFLFSFFSLCHSLSLSLAQNKARLIIFSFFRFHLSLFFPSSSR